MAKKYDAIVVEAGLSGCVCTALLAKSGIRVLVLDKNKQVSGLSRDQVLPGLGGEAVGLAVTVGYCGKNKSNPKSPLPGLFFVGRDAGGGAYIGTNQAVSSGLRVAPVVRHYVNERTSVYRI